MALVVNNNIPALQTYNAVNATTNSLQKSIQKLSSGLRINSAADDAAGLAISEKMRAQIRGLDRAISNSQDGISMIQTAEGALSETHSILQRMRELSVQAANDTLTQQDRGYIQLEIDQLREEVTRIGNTTQFNKKKLLDGSAAVLWSAGDLETKAIVNGGLRTVDQFGQKSAAEGNYKITINAKTGVGEVKKTDIFKIKHGATDEAMYLHTANAEAADVTAITGRDLVPNGEYTVALDDAVVAGAFVRTAFKGGATATNDPLTGGTMPTLVHSDLGGASISVEVVKKETIGADEFLTYNVKANVLALDGSTFAVEKSYILNGTTLDSANLGTMSSYLEGVTLEAAAAHDVGYKSIYNLASDTTTAPNANKSIKVTAPNSSDATGPGTAADNVFHIEAGKVAGKTVDFMTYHLDEVTGDIRTVTTSITFDTGFDDASANGTLTNPDSTGTGTAGAYTAKGNSAAGIIGSTAAESTKLYDIDKFWNSEGRFLLEDPQTLTITQGNGKQATVTLYQNDTIKSLISKLNKAIGTDLGQSAYLASGVPSTSFARFGNASVHSGGALSVDGTIVISSAVTGSAGELSFAGDEDLIKALSLNVLKASTESDYEVTIADAHSGRVFVQNEQVTGNKLIGLVHENIDVVFDSMLGITVDEVDAADYYFKYDYAKDNVITLHLADNTTVFQIGANEGEDMGINVGDMRAEALGLNSVLVTDRESAARSITIIDSAIDKVSMQRAKIGAYQNRLEHTITNLTIAGENLTAAESRIRDTDMAKEMMNFTKLQIMLQAGTSMLAQANTLPQNVLSLIR